MIERDCNWFDKGKNWDILNETITIRDAFDHNDHVVLRYRLWRSIDSIFASPGYPCSDYIQHHHDLAMASLMRKQHSSS